MKAELKASDLRIGNIIASSGNPKNKKTWVIGKVHSISSANSQHEQIEVETEEEFTWFFRDSYFGIPITEYWLKRFGFEEQIGFIVFIGKKYKDKSFEVAWNDIGVWYAYFRNFNPGVEDDFVILRNDLKYVHQLQNLFHSLTGEELTYKEN